MQEIYPGIFTKVIPLRNNPLKSLNGYFIKGEKKNIIVDTGFNDVESIHIMDSTLDELNFNSNNTIVFLTHAHSDHTGLASYFYNKGYDVYISENDGYIVNESVEAKGNWWENVLKLSELQGMKKDNLKLEEHPGFKYRPKEKVDFKIAIPGEIFETDPFRFEIIDLKGHSPGLYGLFDKEKGLFFCGDHILGTITPNITYWGLNYGDSLGHYLDNLEVVKNMNITRLFTSHRETVTDVGNRIYELKLHHEKRLKEALDSVKKHGKATVKMVTQDLHWDIKCRSWEDFPASQKWFAAGEAHAHLEHLRVIGLLCEVNIDGELWFSLKE
ncbi:MAG: MBL fold metallo-hydrolase [Tissierellia bacterium]|nr:MBL fold metallo-hydrolase [Tissierellia bacterium]